MEQYVALMWHLDNPTTKHYVRSEGENKDSFIKRIHERYDDNWYCQIYVLGECIGQNHIIMENVIQHEAARLFYGYTTIEELNKLYNNNTVNKILQLSDSFELEDECDKELYEKQHLI